MRILVAIANYGFKNQAFVEQLINSYMEMPCEKKIVVLSNVPKQFRKEVEIVVGLPTKDPWSLPYSHKKIFYERKADYDLFIYSEDDILITWKNICAFIECSKFLPKNECPGFLRYEVDEAKRKSYPEFHGPYHWIASSVKKIGAETFAVFSNLHSACYILTKNHLAKAIESGGYLVKPHKGKYDLLCSAATDPFTQCGLKKLICVSQISKFLVHHLSNRYSNEVGISEDDFNRQVNVLTSGGDDLLQKELIEPIKMIDTYIYDKLYFKGKDNNLLECVSNSEKNILSVGCGAGINEGIIAKKNIKVTAIPIDYIIGEVAKNKNINVLEPNLNSSICTISNRIFECIIMDDILHHFENPIFILRKVLYLLGGRGKVIISIPNFFSIRNIKKSFPYPVLRRFSYLQNRITPISVSKIECELVKAGLNKIIKKYPTIDMKKWKIPNIRSLKKKLLCDKIYIVACRT